MSPAKEDILAGNPAQVEGLKRALALRRLVADDPRFAFQGRTVSIAGEVEDAADLVIALCRLVGYSSCQFLPRDREPEFSRAFTAAGLRPFAWDLYRGGDAALAAARTFLEGYSPPEDLVLRRVTSETSDSTVRAICQTSLAAAVMPPAGSAMRGTAPPFVMLYVEAQDGAVVATGGGCMAYHPDSPLHREAFWGMLATAAPWRGRRLAGWIGATAILELADRFGARGFSTGVKPDNASSQAMCTRLGITRSDWVYASATDPSVFGESSITR